MELRIDRYGDVWIIDFDLTQMHNEIFGPSVEWCEDSVREYIEDAAKDIFYRIEW